MPGSPPTRPRCRPGCERKYEIDSLSYPVELAYRLWRITGGRRDRRAVPGRRGSDPGGPETEQDHEERSRYRFQRTTRGHRGARSAPARAHRSGRGADARLRARAAARHLHPRAEQRGPGDRRHARGARAHRVREAEGRARRRAASRCSRCWCRSPLAPTPLEVASGRGPRARRSRASASTSPPPARATLADARACPALLADADAAALARDVLREMREFGAQPRADRAPQRAARHHGLPRRGARQPRAHRARDERAAARDGGAPSAPASATTAARRGSRSRWRELDRLFMRGR